MGLKRYSHPLKRVRLEIFADIVTKPEVAAVRLWTLHPKYLDSPGLVALWREALLARAVLAGETEGYTNHPQLERFRESEDPLRSLNTYLEEIYEEAVRRDFSFDNSKVDSNLDGDQMTETRGQLLYERDHLLTKLKERGADRHERLREDECPDAHPMFTLVEGEVRRWEKTNDE